MYNSLLLLSREQFFSFPPAALAGIPVSDAAKVTPELCGCGPPDGAAAPPVDFGSVAQMLSSTFKWSIEAMGSKERYALYNPTGPLLRMVMLTMDDESHQSLTKVRKTRNFQ